MNWIQGLFLFCLVWGVAGTITGDSRKKFDTFFRLLISGTDKDHPKPKDIKLSKVCVVKKMESKENKYICQNEIHVIYPCGIGCSRDD